MTTCTVVRNVPSKDVNEEISLLLTLFLGRLRNGMKYSRVIQLPEVRIRAQTERERRSRAIVDDHFQVLCIHLKRFRHDSMIYTKIGSYVSFPLVDLDMTQFIHRGLFI